MKTPLRILPPLAALSLCVCLIPAGIGCSRQEAAARPEATLEEMNAALNTWVMVKGGLPTSASELTNFPALREKRLPTPPAGQKLGIDPRTRKVTFMPE